MNKHTKIYYDSFRIDPTEMVLCECCGSKAVDIHHIFSRGHLGSSDKANMIENLQALCRRCHIGYGDRKCWRSFLLHKHRLALMNYDVDFDLEWIDNQIVRYEL